MLRLISVTPGLGEELAMLPEAQSVEGPPVTGKVEGKSAVKLVVIAVLELLVTCTPRVAVCPKEMVHGETKPC